MYLSNSQLFAFFKKGCSFHTKGFWGINKDFGAAIIGSSIYNRNSQCGDQARGWIIASTDMQIFNIWKSGTKVLHINARNQTKYSLPSEKYILLAVLLFYIFNRFL